MRKGLFAVAVLALAIWPVCPAAAEVPLGGFIPFVGIGLSDEFKTFDDDVYYFIGDAADVYTGSPLGSGFNDIALLDTGAPVHILRQSAAGSGSFDIEGEGFDGAFFQSIFGATGGSVSLLIDDPLGVFAAGLGDRVSASPSLVMDPNDMRGQTSIAVLEGGPDWNLPSILGLPMAAQHGVVIRNDQPQIFQFQGRTMRTPHVDFIELGTGPDQGIVRRASLTLEPSDSFTTGPFYLPSFSDPNFNLHENPASPTVIDSGGIYLDLDVIHQGNEIQNLRFLFDTGADITVVSEDIALDMGIDIAFDEPDFVVEVEGAGGVASNIPGYYIEEMMIDAVGGSLTFTQVPVVVLDVPDPLSPANIIDAIIGMHVFAGRNLVIDAAPAALIPGASPKLYISDPVTVTRTWSTAAASASWSAGASWASPTGPEQLWSAQAVNFSGSNQTAVVSSNSQVFDLRVAGTPTAKLTVDIQSGATLTTFGQTKIDAGGEVRLSGGKLDAQVVNIEGGTLSGAGQVFVGSGPIEGVVRNLSGRIAPDGTLAITGDLSNLADGTIAIDLFPGGNDLIDVSRSAYLSGTLAVSLTGGLVPSLNQVFTILEYGAAIDLDFDQVMFPAGYQWQLSDNAPAQSLQLKVIGIGDTPGDFNHDGSVDDMDLALWEAGYGAGGYSGLDFLDWQRNYNPSGLAAATSVPEPAALLLALGMLSTALIARSWRTL